MIWRGTDLCFIFFFFLSLTTLTANAGPSSFTVILDPGHGGSDLGAVYETSRFYEKDAVLNLSLETKKYLEKNGIKTLLTRDSDRALSLKERSDFANNNKGSLFISLHMNSAPSAQGLQSGGVETYILQNNSTDGPSKRLAELENKGIKPETGTLKTGHSTVDLILKDLTLSGHHEESMRLGCLLQDELPGVTKQRKRGLKAAQFYVLMGVEMPSALLEAGFVHSAKDRALFLNVHNLRSMAASIARTIQHFREKRRAPGCKLL